MGQREVRSSGHESDRVGCMARLCSHRLSVPILLVLVVLDLIYQNLLIPLLLFQLERKSLQKERGEMNADDHQPIPLELAWF